MFHVHAFNPHPLLRHCVDSYLIVSTDLQEGSYTENNLLPHITQNLVFGLDEGNTVYDCNHSAFTARHFIAGPNDEVCHVRLFAGMKKMIINFKPGGFHKIFRLPAHYFSNRTRDALEFLGKPLIDITHQIIKTSLSGKIELADAFLLKQLQKGQKKTERNIDEAIRLIEIFNGNISIRELELATYTTKRTLERHFLEQVGLYPKTFSRLVRFNGVIRFIESNLNVKWRQLADAFGYYDQSHFINEFKSLTGSLPQDYFSLKTGFEKIMQP
ncbi:MAG TPA: helix-turn-helix domain-containing protein [Puia sp.]|jgi:AraC-like DNA-binding protein|nr:helix-turn-helix domain-containing protein [Puia sp.]